MRKVMAILMGWCVAATALANDSVSIKSAYDVGKTAARFETLLQDNGMEVVERTVKLEGSNEPSPVEEVILFNNPISLSYESRCRWSNAPGRSLSARIWQDDKGVVWVTYRVPEERENRFGVIECGQVKDEIKALITNLATAAAGL